MPRDRNGEFSTSLFERFQDFDLYFLSSARARHSVNLADDAAGFAKCEEVL